jgi:hypothetical protein
MHNGGLHVLGKSAYNPGFKVEERTFERRFILIMHFRCSAMSKLITGCVKPQVI